jgi:predicted AAA+ superfamily ATPase
MRRTGKTTLIRQLLLASDIRQQVYFDLERIDNRELFSEKNYDNIVLALAQRGLVFSKKVLIAIDEIQLAPNLPSVVKYLYDHYNIKFVLTGSSSYYLKNCFSESLAGRKKIFEVYPLTFRELLRCKGIEMPRVSPWEVQPFVSATYERLKPWYEEYINFGGFPFVLPIENRERN